MPLLLSTSDRDSGSGDRNKSSEQQQQQQQQQQQKRDLDRARAEVAALKRTVRELRAQHQRQYDEQEKAHADELAEVEQRHQIELQRHLADLKDAVFTPSVPPQHIHHQQQQHADSAQDSSSSSDRNPSADEIAMLKELHAAQIDQMKGQLLEQKTKNQAVVNGLHEEYDALSRQFGHSQDREHVLQSALAAKDEELATLKGSMDRITALQRKKLEQMQQRLQELTEEIARSRKSSSGELEKLVNDRSRLRAELASATMRIAELENQTRMAAIDTQGHQRGVPATSNHQRLGSGETTVTSAFTGGVLDDQLLQQGNNSDPKRQSILLSAMQRERKGLKAQVARLGEALAAAQSTKASLLRDEMQAREETKAIYEKQLTEANAKVRQHSEEILDLSSKARFYEDSIARCYAALLPTSPRLKSTMLQTLASNTSALLSTTLLQSSNIPASTLPSHSRQKTFAAVTAAEQATMVVSNVEDLAALVEEYEAKLASLLSENAALTEEVGALQKRVVAMESQGSLMEASSNTDAQKLSNLGEKLHMLEAAKASIEDDRKKLRERVQTLVMEIRDLKKAALQRDADHSRALDEQKHDFERKLQDLGQKAGDLQAKARVSDREKDRVMQQAAADALQVQLLKGDVRDLKKEVEALQASLETERETKSVVRERCTTLEIENSRLKAAETDVVALKERQLAVEREKASEIQTLNDRLAAAREKLKEMEAKADQQAKALAQISAKNHALMRKIDTYQNLVADHESIAADLKEKEGMLHHVQAESSTTKARLKRERESLQCIRDDLQRQVDVLTKKLHKSASLCATAHRSVDELQAQVTALKRDVAANKRQHERKSKEHATALDQISTLQQQLRRAKERAAEYEEKAQALERQQQSWQMAAAQKHSVLQETMHQRFKHQLDAFRTMQAHERRLHGNSNHSALVYLPNNTEASRYVGVAEELRTGKENSTSPHQHEQQQQQQQPPTTS